MPTNKQRTNTTKTQQYIDGTDLVTVTTTRENLQKKMDALDSQAADALSQKVDLGNIPSLPVALVGLAGTELPK